ncbi:MAG: hypothetical protein J6W92_04135 [Paludibacteraceae bacterium]|nr:hypothetical protein [Paludibacteraceae bacterium]
MKHLIITRFNIQYEPDSHIGITEQWLSQRLPLFEQYCLTSVQAQTKSDFTWILLCDSNTPDKYKKQLDKYEQIVPQIKIIYSSWVEDVNKLYQQIGTSYVREGEKLLTTRLDNDDRIEPTYVERVQTIAKDMHQGIISFPLGRQTFVSANRSFRMRVTANHFTTRVEDSGYYTILGFDHTKLNESIGSVNVIETDEPMWEEFVHGKNIANGYYPNQRYTISSATDALFIFCKWLDFQWRRIIRLVRRLL